LVGRWFLRARWLLDGSHSVVCGTFLVDEVQLRLPMSLRPTSSHRVYLILHHCFPFLIGMGTFRIEQCNAKTMFRQLQSQLQLQFLRHSQVYSSEKYRREICGGFVSAIALLQEHGSSAAAATPRPRSRPRTLNFKGQIGFMVGRHTYSSQWKTRN